MRVSMGLPVHDWSECAKAARQAEEDGVDVITSNELRHDPFAKPSRVRPKQKDRQRGGLFRWNLVSFR